MLDDDQAGQEPFRVHPDENRYRPTIPALERQNLRRPERIAKQGLSVVRLDVWRIAALGRECRSGWKEPLESCVGLVLCTGRQSDGGGQQRQHNGEALHANANYKRYIGLPAHPGWGLRGARANSGRTAKPSDSDQGTQM